MKQFKLWSNFLFLIPLTYALTHNIWWYSIIIATTFIVSVFFHLSNEKKLKNSDTVISIVLMAANFILLFLGDWMLPYSAVAVIFAAIAIFFYIRQFRYGYNINHSLWHIFSAAVSLFCVLTFQSF